MEWVAACAQPCASASSCSSCIVSCCVSSILSAIPFKLTTSRLHPKDDHFWHFKKFSCIPQRPICGDPAGDPPCLQWQKQAKNPVNHQSLQPACACLDSKKDVCDPHKITKICMPGMPVGLEASNAPLTEEEKIHSWCVRQDVPVKQEAPISDGFLEADSQQQCCSLRSCSFQGYKT